MRCVVLDVQMQDLWLGVARAEKTRNLTVLYPGIGSGRVWRFAFPYENTCPSQKKRWSSKVSNRHRGLLRLERR